ncbi:MAG TPA: chromate transporter [Sphingobacteriaceae bacterium]|nr:chromate transporter [Sphingobacteriaceae bacterium]
MIYLLLVYEFFKIGLFTIGGGLAALPFLQALIPKYGWITADQLLDMIAISEATPGPIGVNVATFVGFRTAGVFGGIIATLATAAPSVIIILLVANSLKKVKEHPIAQGAFYGIRPAVAGLIGAVALELGRYDLINGNRAGTPPLEAGAPFWEAINLPGAVLFLAALFVYLRRKAHPVFILAAAAAVGIFLKL